MPLTILIIGGGLGGLAAAAFLRKSHTITILERSTLDFSRNDYGISIISNAYNLLQKAGIDDSNLDMAVLVKIWQRTCQNEEIHTREFDTRKVFGAPSVLTRRSKLQAELYRLATSGELEGKPAEVIEGVKVERVDADAGEVYSWDGKSYSADFIIGADGINSVVRSAILSENGLGSKEAPAATHDLLAFMAQFPVSYLASIAELALFGDAVNNGGLCSWKAPVEPGSSTAYTKRRILAYHIGPGEVQIAGYATEKEFGPQFDQLRTSIIKGIPASRAQQEFPEFSKAVVDLFDKHKAGDGTVEAWRIRDVDPVEEWHRGRALLIGDAAHAVTPHAGQGCNSAFEDAEALGFLLKDAKTAEDVQTAIPTFLKIRKERTQYIAKASRNMGALLSKEEAEREGELNLVEFGQRTYGYVGAEKALKAIGVDA